MPKIAEIEYTPNPNAVKFQLKEPVTVGFPKAFRDAEVAEHDELAKGLFAVGHVVSVFMQDKFITVTKDDGIGWTELLPKLAPPIRQAPSALGETAQPASHWEAPTVDANDPFIKQILEALASTILPALAADGGGLEIVGRHEKQVMIRYQGACTSCPSGLTGTLMAIEGILRKEVDPEIVVIPV
jgi:NFU1 iron-sulfur cluster scaffold homolog, mitochondrial